MKKSISIYWELNHRCCEGLRETVFCWKTLLRKNGMVGVASRGGRKKRLTQRAAKPVIDPCPPGQQGGAYKPLSETELQSIFDTALKLLANLGLGEVPERLRVDLLAAGAKEGQPSRITYRTLRGIEVSEDNIGYDAILDAVLGEGHFLGSAKTLEAMERDYFYPSHADGEQPRTWAENGAKDAWCIANERVREVLATHKPSYLSPDQQREIKERFNILLE